MRTILLSVSTESQPTTSALEEAKALQRRHLTLLSISAVAAFLPFMLPRDLTQALPAAIFVLFYGPKIAAGRGCVRSIGSMNGRNAATAEIERKGRSLNTRHLRITY